MPSGPKNQKYLNRHAAEAQERDEGRKAAAKEAAERARDDALWKDSDAKSQKKAEKDRESELKALEQERRRNEMKAQLDAEERELNQAKQPTKVTKKMMQREVAKLVASYDQDVAKVRGGVTEDLPAENVNRGKRESTEVAHVVASGLSDALEALDLSKGIPEDRHIGKRARALYRHFCDENMTHVKESHPSMRRSQYNDILWEMWQKSSKNPFVKRSEARNAERLAEERRWLEGGDEQDDE